MRTHRLLNNPAMPFMNLLIEQEEREIARKLEGIDIEQEHQKIQGKKSYLSRSMRELVVWEYERRQRKDQE
mgnify:FL=1